MRSGLSVVIPNYNGTALFPQTLPTVLIAVENTGHSYEIIIVDDCSTDDSVNYLSAHFPQITIIRNEENRGFSFTANRGIKAARYDLVLLLNSDVKLEPSYFFPLFQYFEDPATFGVMGRIVGWNDDKIQDGAKYPSFHSAKIKTSVNYILKNDEEMKKGLFTSYLSGANALMDREKFLELGGFNELFSPFYVEDYELSLRAWRTGFKCYYEHSAVCRHQTSASIRSKSKKEYVRTIYNRNKWFLHAIHLGAGKRFLWFLQLLPEVILQSLLLKKYYIRAFVLFLKNYKEVRSSRRRLKEMAGEKKLLTVQEVASMIKAPVKEKQIIFF